MTGRVLRTPDEWQRVMPDVQIVDPDGWRGNDGPPWDMPIDRTEYLARRDQSTVSMKPTDDEGRRAE